MAVVLKAYTGVKLERMFGMRGTEWMIVTHPFSRPERVSKRDALEFIESDGLVLCSRTEYGDVYDTPRRDFQKKYKGFGSDAEKGRRIDDAMRYFKSNMYGEEGED